MILGGSSLMHEEHRRGSTNLSCYCSLTTSLKGDISLVLRLTYVAGWSLAGNGKETSMTGTHEGHGEGHVCHGPGYASPEEAMVPRPENQVSTDDTVPLPRAIKTSPSWGALPSTATKTSTGGSQPP